MLSEAIGADFRPGISVAVSAAPDGGSITLNCDTGARLSDLPDVTAITSAALLLKLCASQAITLKQLKQIDTALNQLRTATCSPVPPDSPLTHSQQVQRLTLQAKAAVRDNDRKLYTVVAKAIRDPRTRSTVPSSSSWPFTKRPSAAPWPR